MSETMVLKTPPTGRPLPPASGVARSRSAGCALKGGEPTLSGSKTGASDRRQRAVKSYVQPAKLLVELPLATCSHQLDLYGMQEARGSSPLSSTSFPR